jgi:hypothetical protein
MIFWEGIMKRDRQKAPIRRRGGFPSYAVFIIFLCTSLFFFFSSPIQADSKKITNRDLPPPLVESPVDGRQYKGRPPEFKWQKVEGASRYHLQVAEDQGFYLIQDDRKDIWGETYVFYNFGYRPYFFRVCCIDEKGNEGEWSKIIQFIISPEVP